MTGGTEFNHDLIYITEYRRIYYINFYLMKNNERIFIVFTLSDTLILLAERDSTLRRWLPISLVPTLRVGMPFSTLRVVA